MKKIFVYACVYLFFSVQVFAINEPVDLDVTDVSDTSVMLDWTDTPDAAGYYLYYGTSSGSGGSYEIEGIDLIEESEFLVENLLESTQYYFAVAAIDAQGIESAYSEEISVATLTIGETQSFQNFRLEGVEVVDATSFMLSFSRDLSQDSAAVREFILDELSTGVEMIIDTTIVNNENPKELFVIVSNELSEETEYRLTVLDIQDSNGDAISSGIDAFVEFVTPSFSQEEVDIEELSPNTDEENIEDMLLGFVEGDVPDDIELNAAGPENTSEGANSPATEVSSQGNIAGENISLENNTNVAASESDTLPQTGPELWVLVFFTLLVTGMLFFYTQRRNS